MKEIKIDINRIVESQKSMNELHKREQIIDFRNQENETIFKEKLIKHFKERYNFDGFHHYTDILNLYKIIESGKLLSRNRAKELGFVDAADHDVLSHTHEYIMDYVRFYYKEKSPTIYRNEGIKPDNSSPHMPIPVLLLFEHGIIEHSGVAFLSGGGGNPYSVFAKEVSVASNFDWDMIFYRGPIPRPGNGIIFVGKDISGASITNKKNAEFLYPKEISTKYIEKIIFRAPADKKVAEIILGANKLFETDNLREKFNYTHNFLYDYKILLQGNNFVIGLKFDKNCDGYKHEIKVWYNDKSVEKLDILTLNRSRKIDLTKYSEYDNFDYYFLFKPSQNKSVRRLEYLMNGHTSALWEGSL